MRFKIIIASVLILIAAYSLFWFQVASRVEDDTLAWIEKTKNNTTGLKVFVGDLTISGFPYRIVVEASSLNASFPKDSYGERAISMTVPEIAAVYQPWNPSHIIVVTDYFDATIGEINDPEININFDKVKSSIILDAETMKMDNLSIVAEKINWQNVNVSGDQAGSAMEMAELHLRNSQPGIETQSSYDLPVQKAIFFKAKNSEIAELETGLFGKYADEIIIETILHANRQPDFTKLSLSTWRDEGGTLSIKSFEYGTTDAHISFSGDITLDENLKPLGAFDAKVSGIENMFGALSRNENIPQTTRLLLQGQAQSATSSEEVPLSVSMQNGMMYIGPIPILELDAIIE